MIMIWKYWQTWSSGFTAGGMISQQLAILLVSMREESGPVCIAFS